MDLNVPRSLETKLGFISLHNWRKCSDLQSSGYWKMYLWTFSSPWHNPLISPLCKTTPINFSEKDCPLSAMESFFKKRGSPMLYREDTMPLPNWKIMSENVLKLLTYWSLQKWGLSDKRTVGTNPIGQSIMFLRFCVKLVVNTCKMHC